MAGSVTSRVALALELLSELKLDPSERIEVANALGVAAPAPSARAEATTERAKMTSILERQPLPVVIYEPPDFRIALANEAFRSLFGAEGVIGRPLREAYPDARTVLSMLDEVYRTGEPRTRREYIVKRTDDGGRVHEHYFTSLCQPMFDEAGSVTGILALGLDVTQEVLARTMLAESLDRLRVILDELPVGVNVRDATTGEVILSNQASARILGVDVGDRENPDSWGMWTARFEDGRVLESDDHAFRRVMLSGEPIRNLHVILRRSGTGEERVVRSSAAPVMGEEHRKIIVSVFDDITEERRLAREREETARFSERFVGILGHDLRNPLAAITMGAALLESQAPLEASHLRRVRQIASSAARMARMVDQLLDLTRARLSGGIPIARRTTDLVAVVSSVVEELTAAHPTIMLALDLPREMHGEWDGDRLAQVFSNLLGNAIEHGDRTRPIKLALGGDDSTAHLTVENQAPPIPEAVLAGLFDAFRGGRPGASLKSTGLGLGLYITREIVAAHGGSVTVRSAEETVFVVTLPRRLGPEASTGLGAAVAG
jgi:PAS domain S-box-containing protein